MIFGSTYSLRESVANKLYDVRVACIFVCICTAMAFTAVVLFPYVSVHVVLCTVATVNVLACFSPHILIVAAHKYLPEYRWDEANECISGLEIYLFQLV